MKFLTAAVKVCLYFARHPGRELSKTDIADMLMARECDVLKLLERSIEAQAIEYTRGPHANSRLVFKAGPELKAWLEVCK